MTINKQTLNSVKIIILAAILAVGIQYVGAQSWSAPTSGPTSGNAYAPLNVGSTAQIKPGGLHVAYNPLSGGDTATGFTVRYGLVGLGTTNLVDPIRLNVVSDLSAESARFSSNLNDASYIRVRSTAGSNLLGFNPGGPWVGSSAGTGETLPLSFKVGDSIKMSISSDGTVLIPGQVKITGGSYGSGKVLTSDQNGLASWANPAMGSTQIAPNSRVDGATNSQFDTFLTDNGMPGAHPPWNKWSVSCPANKPMLVSCSGGIMKEMNNNTDHLIVPTIIIPDTTNARCDMYSEYDYEGGTNDPNDDGALRLYAICI
jgi:hypothetical protein